MPTWIWKYMINCEGISDEERNRICETYHEYGKEAFYEEAIKRKILPFTASTLIRLQEDVDFWSNISNEYRQRNIAILTILDEAYAALKKHGVKKMFVSENFGALLSSQKDISLFASGDVDNYADPSEKKRIYEAFEELGYKRKERFSEKHQIAAEFFPPKDKAGLPDDFYISVDFYPLARLKLPCFIRADEFVAWDEVTTYHDTSVILPPPSALMYICLLHISLHSFSRAPDIRLYIDLLNMAQTEIDYNQIVCWCQRDKTCVRASTAALLCNQLLRTDISNSIVSLSTRKEKVIKLVYNSAAQDLQYEPRGLKVLKIELACDDRSIFHGLHSILFPDAQWMKDTYGSVGILAHLKHFIKVI